MKKRKLGYSDLYVSELCLGTMNFGWKEPEASSIERLEQFVAAGGDFIDTANVYSRREQPGKDFYGKDFSEYIDGTSERLIGKWVREKGNRQDLVIATKVGFPYPGIEMGTSAKQIRQECERSLKRLQTDYIDLMYLHTDDRSVPLEESLGTLTELVKQGKVRQIGVSNFTTWRLAQACEVAKKDGLVMPCCVQQKHSYLRPKVGSDLGRQVAANDELFDFLRSNDITLLAYSPLLKGYYGNKSKWLPVQYEGPDAVARMSVLEQISEETGATCTQIVYYWLLHTQPSAIPMVAASTTEQFREAQCVLSMTLSQEQMTRLDAAGI